MYLHNISKFSSYLTGYTLWPCYKDQTVNAVGEIITVYCVGNNMEHINTLCRQTAEFLNVENRWHI
jgi:hypothetical protein